LPSFKGRRKTLLTRRTLQHTALVLIIAAALLLLFGILAARQQAPWAGQPAFVCRELSRDVVVYGEQERAEAERQGYSCAPLE